MTMYLSNRDIRPTGFEPGECIEVEPMSEHVMNEPIENDPEHDTARDSR